MNQTLVVVDDGVHSAVMHDELKEECVKTFSQGALVHQIRDEHELILCLDE